MSKGMCGSIAVGAMLLLSVLISGCLPKVDPEIEISGTSQTQNLAPSISGNPQNAIMTGDRYSFTPDASDPDGDALEFSVQNLPIWASFDTQSGQVTGQPSLADVGIFDGVIISVSDGAASATLPTFSITVSQLALGSVTLSWIPPTTNMDGSALTDLAGYCIYYGPSAGEFLNRIEIDTAGLATYVVENLLPNEYDFVITAVNSSGFESPFSNVAFKYLP